MSDAQEIANTAAYQATFGLNGPGRALLNMFQSLDAEGQSQVLSQLSFLPLLDRVAPDEEAGVLVNSLLSHICIFQAVHVLTAGHGPFDAADFPPALLKLNYDGLDEVATRDVDRSVRTLLRDLHHLAREPRERSLWYDSFQRLGNETTTSNRATIAKAVDYINRFRNICSPAKMSHYTDYLPAATSLTWQSLYRIFRSRIAQFKNDDDSVKAFVLDVSEYPETEIDDAEALSHGGEAVREETGEIHARSPPPPAVGDRFSLPELWGSTGLFKPYPKSVEDQAYHLFLKNYVYAIGRGESRFRHFQKLSPLDQSHIMDILLIFAWHVSRSNRGTGANETIRKATAFLVSLAVTVKTKYRINAGVAKPFCGSARMGGILEMVSHRNQDLSDVNPQYVKGMIRWVFNTPNTQARRFVANKLLDLWQTGVGTESRSEGPDKPSSKRQKTVDTSDNTKGEDGEEQPPMDVQET